MPPRIVDENSPHNLRRDRKEVSTVLPRDLPCVHQAKVRFIHQGSRLQRPLRALLPHLQMSNPMEFPVHDRSELLKGSLISVAPGPEKPAYLRNLLRLLAIAWFHSAQLCPEMKFRNFMIAPAARLRISN